MKNKIKISAIITSGGTSTRFGSNKLLESIGDLTVIETTILKFKDKVDKIIIPAGEETKNFILNSEIYDDKIIFAPAGETRQKSVYNALKVADNCDIVLIHDGARPYISSETIDEAIEKTKKYKAVIVGKMATDTIKTVKDGKIINTLDRRTIFHAQTPQCFEFELIKRLHEKYKDCDYTDDSMLIEAEGLEAYILEVKGKNEKITLKSDLA